MKRLAIGILVVMLASVTPTAQDPERLFKSAMNTELVDGNLKAAIEQYQRVAKSGNRALAAQALVRMAGCHEKLGDAQARKIYEQVVRDYADQAAAVAEARAQLGGRATATGATGMLLRKVWSDPKVSSESHVSPDGRFISYPDWETGNLAVHDLATGTDRRLTDTGYVERPGAFAQGSAISRDMKQIAYAWYNGRDRYELRTIALQSAGFPRPRTLVDQEDVHLIVPFDWTPDGKWIAVHLQRKDRTSQLSLVSAQDGSLRVLKSVDWRASTRLSLSPDGKYLGFDLPEGDSDTQQRERDVFVLAVDGSRETRVVANPGLDQMIGWSPDGTHLLFASERTGSLDLWALPIADGRAQGAPLFVKPGIAPSSIGVSTSGALFTVATIGNRDIKIASLDLDTGKLLTAPLSPVRSFVGVSQGPDWSRDGKSLVYVSARPTGRVLVIRSTETGHARDLSIAMTFFFQPRWAPDGRSFIVKGRDLKGREGVYQIDAQTGGLSQLAFTPNTGSSLPQLSPDGKKLYFWGGNVLRGTEGSVFLERDLASGTERELYRGQDPVFPNLSPDGRYLVGSVYDDHLKSSAVVLIPVTGGDRKELLRVSDPKYMGNVTWTPDGRSVIVPVQGKAGQEILLVPTDGGTPRQLQLDLRIGMFWGVRLHPDGRQIAFVTDDDKAEVWVLENFLPKASAR